MARSEGSGNPKAKHPEMSKMVSLSICGLRGSIFHLHFHSNFAEDNDLSFPPFPNSHPNPAHSSELSTALLRSPTTPTYSSTNVLSSPLTRPHQSSSCSERLCLIFTHGVINSSLGTC